MNRILSIVAGPEFYWVIVYLVCRGLAARNIPPTAAGNTALNWAVWVAATLGVLASFVTFAVPASNRWALFARLTVAGFIGLNACAIVICEAIKYPEPGRDSGLMALWFLAVGVGAIIWGTVAVVTMLMLRTRSQA